MRHGDRLAMDLVLVQDQGQVQMEEGRAADRREEKTTYAFTPVSLVFEAGTLIGQGL